jgi:hypothetical protein
MGLRSLAQPQQLHREFLSDFDSSDVWHMEHIDRGADDGESFRTLQHNQKRSGDSLSISRSQPPATEKIADEGLNMLDLSPSTPLSPTNNFSSSPPRPSPVAKDEYGAARRPALTSN